MQQNITNMNLDTRTHTKFIYHDNEEYSNYKSYYDISAINTNIYITETFLILKKYMRKISKINMKIYEIEKNSCDMNIINKLLKKELKYISQFFAIFINNYELISQYKNKEKICFRYNKQNNSKKRLKLYYQDIYDIYDRLIDLKTMYHNLFNYGNTYKKKFEKANKIKKMLKKFNFTTKFNDLLYEL